MKKISTLFTLFFALTPSSIGVADPFDDAVDAFKNGSFSTAYGLFYDLAQKEHALSQLNVATLTAKGDGIIQSDKDALFWSWRARFAGANQAIPTIAYLKSRTTPEDQTSVARELRFTYVDQFDKGDKRAAFKMGRTLNEVYVPRDVYGAYVWFTISAALNIKYAKALRETISVELDVQTRAKAQDEARTRLSKWCIHQTKRPVVGENLVKLGES
jgi:TPR repeat protein